MEYKDYYKIMGLKRDATADEIKRTYRKLARKYHPDVSKEANATTKFQELGEAYEVLSDPEKRQAYDQLGSQWQAGQDFRPPPGGRQAHDFHDFNNMGDGQFSDFFESLFGGGMGRGQRRQHYAARGEDLHAKITVPLEDAFKGVTTQIQVPVTEIVGRDQIRTTNKTLKVKIPAGVKSGQQIRLTGQGGPGASGAPAGDLYLEIELQEHPLFSLVGQDVYLTLPISPWEAALGATVTVPTLEGSVSLKIPAGSQAGQKMRLKGKGLASNDQYVLLKIVIPPVATAEAKALYQKMSEIMPFNPREKLGVAL